MKVEKSIWFDFENAPHVWVLKPIYEYFRDKGYRCCCSARRFSYTVELLRRAGIDADIQPWRVSSSRSLKAFNIFLRSKRLVDLYRRRNLSLAVCHGSRSQILAARIMKVPVISMEDYEKSDQFMVRFTARTLVPDVIDKAHWGRYQDRIAHYPGLKEHIYLPDLNTGSLSRPEGKVIVILRPEAWTGHYYRRRSTRLLHRLIRHLGMNRSVKIIFLPRDLRQQAETEAIFRQLGISYETPPPGTYGFEIVARADLVIGGGGTMLREAACLGIPAYSYFAGERGDVDAYLEAAGRLHRIDTEADMERIRAVKRTQELDRPGLETRKYIVNFIEGFLLGRGVNADR